MYMKKISCLNLVNEKELKGKNLAEGIKLLGFNRNDFTFGYDDGVYDFDCQCLVDDEKYLITYTINQEVKEDELLEDIEKMNGYWHYSIEY